MRLLCVSIFLSACSSPPCALVRLADDPTAGPGELRHVFAADQDAQLASTPDGVVCLSCGTVVRLDGALRERLRVGVALQGHGQVASTGDTTFVLDVDSGLDPDHGDDRYVPQHLQLIALSSAGLELWRNDLGDGEGWTADIGGSNLDGPLRAFASILGGPTGPVVHGFPLASVFEPVNGRLRSTASVNYDDAIVADDAGSLFIASGVDGGPDKHQATLHRVDGEGRTVWTTTWDALPSGEVRMTSAARTAGGGFLVAGRFSSETLAIGSYVLQSLSRTSTQGRHTNFVAAVDGRGTPLWAVTVGKADETGYVDDLQVAAAGDGAVICGTYAGPQLGLPDTGSRFHAFVARVDAGGVAPPYAIGGGGEVRCDVVAADDDGSASALVRSDATDSSVAIRVGRRAFEAGAPFESWLLNIAL